jgi:hypothetical protein
MGGKGMAAKMRKKLGPCRVNEVQNSSRFLLFFVKLNSSSSPGGKISSLPSFLFVLFVPFCGYSVSWFELVSISG